MNERNETSIYPVEGRVRIKRITRERFNHFFGEIPKRALKTVLRRLRPIDGFRPDSDAAMDEQKRRLLKRLTEDAAVQGSEGDWRVLQTLWFQWVLHKLQGNGISTAVHTFVNAAEADRKVALEDLLLVCISEAEHRTVSREVLSCFFEFGPFAVNADTDEVISVASLDSDLTGQQLLTKLPEVLRKIDARFNLVELEASKMDAHCDKLSEETKRIEVSIGDNSRHEQLVVQELTPIKLAQSKLSIDVAAIAGKLAKLDTAASRLTLLESEISSRCNKLDETIVSVIAEVGSIQERLVLATTNPTSVPLGAERASNSSYSRRHSPEKAIAFTLFEVPFTYKRVDKTINSAAELAHAIGQNLISVGMNRDQTTHLGMELCAALCSGQLISFSGSFGILAAVAAMFAVSPRTQATFIPIGFHDDRKTVDDLVRTFVSSDDTVNLFFDGANRSAFDAYADGLIECIALRQSGIVSWANASFYCRLVDGPTGLPPTPAYSAIGPIIDTDALSWRKNRGEIVLLCGKTSSGPMSLGDQGNLTPESLKDLMLLLDPMASRNRRSFELTARNASMSMLSLARDTKVDDDIIGRSLLANWFLPYMLSCGIKQETIARRLSASAVADYLTDPRVATILGRPLNESVRA